VASDVRWHSRSIGDAIQVLLEVTGEDHITVHRKNKQAWKGQLGVRFMLMSNDTPTFSDRSGALVDRMLYVSFKQSFYGREDTGLTEKLMTELPGIFNWAMDGLDRLNSRGRFTQPESGREEADSTRRLADPIGAFIEDWCEIGPEQSITLDHLYLKYQAWCEGEGRTRDTTTKEIFSRDLRAKIDGLVVDRTRIDGRRTRVLKGIGSTEM
jgi:putative DNA primase/helicase